MGYAVRTDGYFDTSTMSAVLDIQATHDLEETGQLNDETLLVINEALDAYKSDPLNDSQLQAAFLYLNENND
jgi:carboxyl-terminal processing protease